jgi:drug/metabolite transporter (DMT)-like permease
MLLQQIFCIVFFYIVSNNSETFKRQAGEISFQDFYVLKHYYISFAIVFMVNTIVIFVGTQLIINASMFQTLRKLVLVKVYFIDLFFGYKKITCFTSICVFMVTIGSVLAGVDTFSRDYVGIALTMVSNFINVAYNKFTESFRRRTNVPNLKLLVYNSYISGPVLFVLIFLTGEYKKVGNYFTEEKYLGENNEGSFYGFIIMLFISCSLCIVLNSSFFMSNEKNSSLFTQLLANTKDLFTCILSRFILAGNKFTLNIVLGLFISTVGAMMFSMKSICDNMI